MACSCGDKKCRVANQKLKVKNTLKEKMDFVVETKDGKKNGYYFKPLENGLVVVSSQDKSNQVVFDSMLSVNWLYEGKVSEVWDGENWLNVKEQSSV